MNLPSERTGQLNERARLGDYKLESQKSLSLNPRRTGIFDAAHHRSLCFVVIGLVLVTITEAWQPPGENFHKCQT
jgi:hypothetical protein